MNAVVDVVVECTGGDTVHDITIPALHETVRDGARGEKRSETVMF